MQTIKAGARPFSVKSLLPRVQVLGNGPRGGGDRQGRGRGLLGEPPPLLAVRGLHVPWPRAGLLAHHVEKTRRSPPWPGGQFRETPHFPGPEVTGSGAPSVKGSSPPAASHHLHHVTRARVCCSDALCRGGHRQEPTCPPGCRRRPCVLRTKGGGPHPEKTRAPSLQPCTQP